MDCPVQWNQKVKVRHGKMLGSDTIASSKTLGSIWISESRESVWWGYNHAGVIRVVNSKYCPKTSKIMFEQVYTVEDETEAQWFAHTFALMARSQVDSRTWPHGKVENE